jgi:hypothetical protein
MTDTRAAFEAHFQLSSRQAKKDNAGEYIDQFVRARWEGWQAAINMFTPSPYQPDMSKKWQNVNISIPPAPPMPPSKVGPIACQQRMKEAGQPYPRTCPSCGLGPCHRRVA